MADVHDFVSQALQEGHDINDIVSFLGNSKNSEDKAWAQQYQQTAAAPAYQPGYAAPAEPAPSQTGLLDAIQQNPKTALATAAGAYGLIKAPGLYNAYQDRQIKKEELDIERQKAQTYAQQVEKQNISSGIETRQIGQPGAVEAPIVSPVEQIRLEREQIKLQREQAAAAHEAEVRKQQLIKLTRENEAAAAKQEKLAKGATSATGLKPEEVQMLANSEKAKAQKAIDSSLKAMQPQPSAPPEIAAAAVTPPAQVANDIVQEVKPLPDVVEPSNQLATEPEKVTPKTVEENKPAKVKAPVVPVDDRIPSYPNPKRNKLAGDVIGQGGWHWYQGQLGPEAEANWLRTYGRTNQPYSEVKQAVKEGRLTGAEVKEGKGGAFPREATVPSYIRGSASLEAMARTGLGALGIMPVAQKIKEKDYKGALNELIPAMAMISPSMSLAMSPLYTSEEEIATLKKAEQARKVGAGRGIAPPSDYMR